MWAQYQQHKGIRRQLEVMKPGKRDKFHAENSAELILFDAADRYLKGLRDSGEAITPKQWQSEVDTLTAEKGGLYQQMRSMREEIRAVEQLRKTAEQLPTAEQPKHKEATER